MSEWTIQWNWFNEVSYPEVRRRTCHPVVLLMDNAPGNFEAFKKENVMVCYFTPNVISWKHLWYLGVIAVVKNKYKFLILKPTSSQ